MHTASTLIPRALLVCLLVSVLVGLVTSRGHRGHGHHKHHDKSKHDIYKHPGSFHYSSAAKKTGFTDEEKAKILTMHNAYRSMVVPEATDMRELLWDNDLEEFARNHTQKCTGAHSNRTMMKQMDANDPGSLQKWDWMGEVLYYSYNSNYSIDEAMWMWWREGEDYDIKSNKCEPGKKCGHYQVMTTARNFKVGCSLNECQKFSISKYPTPAVFMACVYDAPYFNNVRPYTVGKACSDCIREKHGYHFQYCRHKLCIGPELRSENKGFQGSTKIVGF